jgi:hypothetical protein
MSANRVLASVVGAVYLLVGCLGFMATTRVGFFATDGGLLFAILEVNPFHNLVNLLLGSAMFMAGLSGLRPARAVNLVAGTVLLLIGLLGLFIVGTPFNILAMNVPDHVLHFASAALLLAVGLGAERASSPVR